MNFNVSFNSLSLSLVLVKAFGSSVLEKPSQPEDGARSTDEKGPSVGPIAAGVGVTFVVMAMLMGFVVYKMRR